MRRLRLIWDFRGPNAQKTAEHHVLHLNDYLKAEEILFSETGIKVITEMHTIAFLIVNESHMKKIRNDLKPHRGELYEGQ